MRRPFLWHRAGPCGLLQKVDTEWTQVTNTGSSYVLPRGGVCKTLAPQHMDKQRISALLKGLAAPTAPSERPVSGSVRRAESRKRTYFHHRPNRSSHSNRDGRAGLAGDREDDRHLIA